MGDTILDEYDKYEYNPLSNLIEDNEMFTMDSWDIPQKQTVIVKTLETDYLPIPSSNILHSSFNLTNVTIGIGILTFPFILSKLGLVIGIGLYIVVAILSSLSLDTLFLSSEKISYRNIRNLPISFNELVLETLGKKWRIVADLMLILYNLGTSIALFMAFGNIMSDVIKVSFPGNNQFFLKEHFIVFVSTLIVSLPLSFVRDLKFLSYSSLVSTIALLFNAIFISTLYFIGKGERKSPLLLPEKVDIDFFQIILFSTILFTYSFNSHSVIIPVAAEVKKVSRPKLRKVIFISTTMTSIVYLCFGIFGYLNFADVKSNVSVSYGNDVVSNISKFCLGISLLLKYPMHCFTFRLTIFLFKDKRTKMNPLFLILVTVGFYLVSVFLAIFLDSFESPHIDISVLFFYIGAVSSVPMMFLFPGLILTKVTRKLKILGYLLIVVGILLCILGTVFPFYYYFKKGTFKI